MLYTSTRDSSKHITAAEAIVGGISSDGGLYVPESFPTLDADTLAAMTALSYPERVAKVLSLYMDEFSYEELLGYAQKAYSRFDGDPCPIVKVDESTYIMELWHGPTFAFKDMALTLLPYLLTASKRKLGINDKTLVLVATSGDTGKAALEGFKDVDGTAIMVFYPNGGVSEMQRLQMVTQEGSNVKVAAIEGNFDDAQSAVKRVFTDEAIKEELAKQGIGFSSANSINWGRLAPQIAYYVSAYVDMLDSGEIENGDKINFVVPTGNFGNVLAGYYAKRMGVPIDRLIVASNQNNVLSDFFHSGEYDINRDFFLSISPSMDILISSNLERLIFELCGRDSAKVVELMSALKQDKHYTVDVSALQEYGFEAGWASEEETADAIANFFDINDYLTDTHTGVAVAVYMEYVSETGDETPTVIVSTASPYKFAADIYNIISETFKSENAERDAFRAMQKLEMLTGLDVPQQLNLLRYKPILHENVVSAEGVADAVKAFAQTIA